MFLEETWMCLGLPSAQQQAAGQNNKRMRNVERQEGKDEVTECGKGKKMKDGKRASYDFNMLS